MALSRSLVTVLALLTGVRGLCDPEVLRRINRLQRGRPPSDILPQLVGVTTYLYIPSFNRGYAKELTCYQTVLDYDERSATDFLFFADPGRNGTASYEIDEYYGQLTLMTPGEPDDFMYVVSLEEGVMGFYQCGGLCDGPGCDYEPFVGIGVVDYDPWDPFIAAHVERAEEALRQLGVPLLDRIQTSCHAGLRHDVVKI